MSDEDLIASLQAMLDGASAPTPPAPEPGNQPPAPDPGDPIMDALRRYEQQVNAL